MKFSKELLISLVDGEEPENITVIGDTFFSKGRWSIRHRMIFLFENRYYETFYSYGATEYQEELPYEYEPNEIECREVFKKEKVIFVYE